MADTYKVTNQRQTVELGPDGRFRDVMEVSFQTDPAGVHGQVRVPLDQYGPERVDAMISDYVDKIHGVHEL